MLPYEKLLFIILSKNGCLKYVVLNFCDGFALVCCSPAQKFCGSKSFQNFFISTKTQLKTQKNCFNMLTYSNKVKSDFFFFLLLLHRKYKCMHRLEIQFFNVTYQSKIKTHIHGKIY